MIYIIYTYNISIYVYVYTYICFDPYKLTYEKRKLKLYHVRKRLLTVLNFSRKV